MDDQAKILTFMGMTGPVLPAQVAKHISSNILLASAHLSELASGGKVKVSHLKIGGSPLYYLPSHSEKLQNFVHHLNPKDQRVLNLLKEKKLLKEKNLDLLARVSLRGLKDFAVPLKVTINHQKELFWKWHLLDEQQATQLIKSQLPTPGQPASPEPPRSASPKKELSPQPKPAPKIQESLKETPKKTFPRPKETSPLPKKEKPMGPKTPLKKPLFQKLKDKFKSKRKKVPDKFFPQIDSFFQERNIEIESKETVRKNAEMNFLLKVPSVVGKMTYFCKAKSKKRCDEKDLSAAYMEAQTKKLPLLFLYTNEISKKAKEMLDSGAFENLTLKRLD